jgi:hypothetical protein
MSVLATDLRRALDAPVLAERIGMTCDPWQTGLLRSTAPRVLLLACRQAGKSTALAVLALHTALYSPGSLVLVVSASERQAAELLRIVLALYRVLGKPTAAESERKLALELENGSRVVVVPSSAATIRGYAGVRLLVLDEAAQIPDETFAAVSPMVSVSEGRIVAASTPFGRRGFFAELWHRGEGWERFKVRGDEVPRLSPEVLAEQRLLLGEWFYRTEFDCEFIDVQTAAFRAQDIEAMFDPEVIPWEL